MGRILIAGDVVALEAIEGDAPLRERLHAVPHGGAVELDIGGFMGRWERVADGLRPAGAAADVLSSLRGRTVEIHAVGPNETHLATFEERLHRWDVPESRIYSR
jgi:hypothetical protein